VSIEQTRAKWGRRLIGLVVLAVTVAVPAAPARADELIVFSAGAVRAIVTELSEAFRQETGHAVALSFGTVGVTRGKIASGAPVDVVIMTDTAVDDVIREGALVAGSRADLARTGMGVGVREGAPRPDISTPEAFKATLLAAKSLVYVDPAQGATSGIHFKSVLERLGIADAVRAKTQLVAGGYPAEKVASGQAELVVHQISEIVPVKGVVMIGPLPADLQKVTVYSAGLAARSTHPEAARAFVALLTRPAFRPKFAAAGLDYRP
jgi:molybdate transport system substrate-binding protein